MHFRPLICNQAAKLTTIFLVLLSAHLSARAQCTFTNNDFETGNLTGWTAYNRSQSGSTGNWYNFTGTTTPQTFHSISAPPQGTRGAVTDHNGPSTHELYQAFTLPAGQSGTLSFYLAYNNTWTSFITLN